MKKRIMAAALAATLTASVSTITASALNVGDVIGQTLYTDIVASIDGHNIASYNYNGYTMVVAEDLRNYGFDVTWDGSARTLTIDRDNNGTAITSTYVSPKVPANILGTKSNDVLYTDIRTYVCGNQIEGYNIGGLTVINFNSLAPFGAVVYNNDTRTLDITLENAVDKYYPGTDIPSFTAFSGNKPVKVETADDGLTDYFHENVGKELLDWFDTLLAEGFEVIASEEGNNGGYNIIFMKGDTMFAVATGANNGRVLIVVNEQNADLVGNDDYECYDGTNIPKYEEFTGREASQEFENGGYVFNLYYGADADELFGYLEKLEEMGWELVNVDNSDGMTITYLYDDEELNVVIASDGTYFAICYPANSNTGAVSVGKKTAWKYEGDSGNRYYGTNIRTVDSAVGEFKFQSIKEGNTVTHFYQCSKSDAEKYLSILINSGYGQGKAYKNSEANASRFTFYSGNTEFVITYYFNSGELTVSYEV